MHVKDASFHTLAVGFSQSVGFDNWIRPFVNERGLFHKRYTRHFVNEGVYFLQKVG